MRSLILSTLLLIPALCTVTCAQSDRPLNIVIVLTDDLGWTDLSCQGSPSYRSPNIDRLAASGLRFTDAYAACAVCSPTRAAILTGRSPARTGVTDWIRAKFQRPGKRTPSENPSEYVGGRNRKLLCPPNPFWLDHEEITLAEALKAEGYRSCHIGKWHLGDEAWYPQHQGFDENYGGCDYGQPPSYFDPYRNARLTGIPTLSPRKKGEYLTDREGDEAAAFIRRNKDRPFFLYLAHYAVHTPIQAKKDLRAEYAKRIEKARQRAPGSSAENRPPSGRKTKQTNAKYAAMVHSVDDAMGKLLNTLEATGIAEHTLVIFTSDNGGLLGPTHNAPLRSGKGYPYEGGIRVPLIIRWPGVTKPGTTTDQIATSVDLFPTVLDILKKTPGTQSLDGISLTPQLRDPMQRTERSAYWHFPHYRGSVVPYSIIRDGDWKLIKRYEGPSFELFNLANDLGETHNLALDHPDRVKRMDASLHTRLVAQNAKLPRPNPNYKPPARVLLLGDSISIGYHAAVVRQLSRSAVVHRPTNSKGHPENCAGTTKGLANLDRWLAQHGGHWDLIHFNFGLHDLKRVHATTGKNSNQPSDPRQAELEQYRTQLQAITAKLQSTGAKLVFATTTPVPTGVKPYRIDADVLAYNAAARAIMAAQNIPVDDLYSFVAERRTELERPHNVHFTAAGSKRIAGQVAKTIRNALAR